MVKAYLLSESDTVVPEDEHGCRNWRTELNFNAKCRDQGMHTSIVKNRVF